VEDREATMIGSWMGSWMGWIIRSWVATLCGVGEHSAYDNKSGETT
jgi:hypothetical protein